MILLAHWGHFGTRSRGESDGRADFTSILENLINTDYGFTQHPRLALRRKTPFAGWTLTRRHLPGHSSFAANGVTPIAGDLLKRFLRPSGSLGR